MMEQRGSFDEKRNDLSRRPLEKGVTHEEGTPIYGTFDDERNRPGNQRESSKTKLINSDSQNRRRGDTNDLVAKLRIDREALSIFDLEKKSKEDQSSSFKGPKMSDSSQRNRKWDKNGVGRGSSPHFNCFKNWILSFFPILIWLPKYHFAKDLFSDVVAGSTVAIMQVPQGMAYAMLASVPPVVGLYTSFFPALVYFFFGTSKHGSIGTFALISMMTNTAMEDVLGDLRSSSYSSRQDVLLPLENSSVLNGTSTNLRGYFLPEITPELEPIDVAVVVAFLVGIIEILMGLFRMGSLTVLMSDQMISGLITGTAVQVLTSQLKPMTGANIEKYSGAFNTVLTWFSFLERIETVNWEIILVTTVSLSFLILVKLTVDPFFKEKLKIPFPAELILVIIGTTLSHQFHFKEFYNIDVIGSIPTGLVSPKIPHFELIPKLLTGGAMVSIVAVSLSLSIVMSYGKKHHYQIDSNQELLAYGLSNSLSSFFSCIPCSISLSRSAVLETSGAKSQLSTLVSCLLLLIVILVLGPLFAALPDAILSVIIVVALRSMFAGVGDLISSWKTSKDEALVWLVTFLGVIVLDIDYGLAIGVFFSLSTVLYHAHRPSSTTILGQLDQSDLYVDVESFPRSNSVRQISGIRIINIPGPLYFGNREAFRARVLDLTSNENNEQFGGQPTTLNQFVKSTENGSSSTSKTTSSSSSSSSSSPSSSTSLSCNLKMEESQLLVIKLKPKVFLHHVILDCAAMSFIDTGGVASLRQLSDELFQRKGAILFLAGVQGCVMKMFENCLGISSLSSSTSAFNKSRMFPSVHDAVTLAIRDELNSRRNEEEQRTSEYICL